MNIRLPFILIYPLFFTLTITAQTWTQEGSDIDGESAGHRSGRSISLSSDGSTVAIGSWGNDGNGSDAPYVRIYKNISGTWTQVGSDINREAPGDGYSFSCLISLSSDGSVVAIGAPWNDGNGINAGQVRIYKNISGTWTQVGSDIDGEAAYDYLGLSVSLNSDGSTIAIGVPFNGTNPKLAGYVRVYKNISDNWIQVGSDIYGEAAGDYSGYSVSLSSDGSIVAIGAVCNDGNGDSSGHVRVYGNISGNWTQIGSDIDGEAAYDYSGNTVSLSSDGSIVAIGADCNFGNDSNSGYVRVYKNTSGTWTQIGSDINGEEDGDRSGISISLSNDGSIVAIGAHSNDGNGLDAGHVRIYKNISGTWTQVGSDIDGEAVGDGSGYSVSLSSDGSIVAIGARNNDGNGSNAGHVRVYSWVGTTSVLNILSNVSISLFPNPTSGSVHIQTSPELIGAGYRVTTNYGSEVLQGEISGFDTQLDLKDFAEGVYFINVGDKLQQSLKVMKR
ncbi:MAG: Flp pilus assembly pilin Flp [Bacteroidia bacterium]|jgi:Flp pilus assembly pilin Flp